MWKWKCSVDDLALSLYEFVEGTSTVSSYLTSLDLKIGNKYVIYVIDFVSYDFQSFFGEVGGTLGLMLGISLPSIFQIFIKAWKTLRKWQRGNLQRRQRSISLKITDLEDEDDFWKVKAKCRMFYTARNIEISGLKKLLLLPDTTYFHFALLLNGNYTKKNKTN